MQIEQSKIYYVTVTASTWESTYYPSEDYSVELVLEFSFRPSVTDVFAAVSSDYIQDTIEIGSCELVEIVTVTRTESVEVL